MPEEPGHFSYGKLMQVRKGMRCFEKTGFLSKNT